MTRKVIDLHCDSVYSLMSGKNLREDVPGVHIDLPRLRKGGVALQVFAAYVPAETPQNKAFAFAVERLAAIDAFARSGDPLSPVESAEDLRDVMAAGKTGIMASLENGLAIENSLSNLEALRRLKVRIMTLVHSEHLSWAASCTGTGPFSPDGGSGTSPQGSGTFPFGSAIPRQGLSSFGKRVIDMMNDLGIMVDLSHSSEETFWEVIGRSRKPVIASHSCAFALCGAARNLKDDQLKALGDSGGLVGVNFYSAFLSEPFRQVWEAGRNTGSSGTGVSLRETGAQLPEVPPSLIADHIDYMVKLAGEDCVALGSDFDGISAAPEGVGGSDFYPLLEAELKGRGYTEKRIDKIWSGNFIRVFGEWDK